MIISQVIKNLKGIIFLSFLLFVVCSISGNSQEKESERLGEDFIYLADPTIMEFGDTYYLYGTTGNPELGKDQGFLVYTSKDLTIWEGPNGVQGGLALKKGDAFGDQGFWAPHVFRYRDKFYMIYTANEQIAVASSNSPLGPFKSASKDALKAPVKQIDPFVFFDDDGKIYLYHVRLIQGNRIFVAELNKDLTRLKPNTLNECISGELSWENTQKSDWPVTEGPTVLKHKGLYYLIYSANDFRNPDYAVGYATSLSPLGPWVKSERSPIIHNKIIQENGTGHGDIFIDRNGFLQYVLHTHLNSTTPQPRRTAIIQLGFKESSPGLTSLKVDLETFRFLQD